MECIALLGTPHEAETGAPTVLPLREQPALLALLLALRSSAPSVRRRQASFQAGATCACASGAEVGAMGSLALAAAVFAEVPDPHALTEVSPATAVLLPRELGYPRGAYAGECEARELGACLAARPAWDPTAAAYAPRPAPAAWLPLPPALVEMRSDTRRGRGPVSLGLPPGLLMLDGEPGALTLLGSGGTEDVSDSEQSEEEEEATAAQPGHPATAATATLATRVNRWTRRSLLAGGPGLWTVQEAELARDGLLALQGVRSALVRLQAALAAPASLPRRSAAGLVAQLAAAGEVRQRLQRFVDVHTGTAAAPTAAAAGSAAADALLDPVQQAFAAGVSEVLRQQAAALQLFEQTQGRPWLEEVVEARTDAPPAAATSGASGAQPIGMRFHRPALSLLQVALHTGALQRQLAGLALLCWCDGAEARRCWEAAGFPAGAELLSYLYACVQAAQQGEAVVARRLFSAAAQPYLRHLAAWAFSTREPAPEFAAGGEALALQLELDFVPPAADGAPQAAALMPAPPPAFLRPLHAALMRAGTQLRLLASLPEHGAQLARQLAAVSEAEQHARLAACQPGGGGCLTAHGKEAPPPLALEGGPGVWLAPAGEPGSGADEVPLHLPAASLQAAVRLSQRADAARADAVDAWLARLALQRRLAEHAAESAQLERAAALRERQAQREAARAVALSRRLSGKAALLQEQRLAVEQARARVVVQRAAQCAEERRQLAAEALQDHASAVTELSDALAAVSVGTAAATATGRRPQQQSPPATESTPQLVREQQRRRQQHEAIEGPVQLGLPPSGPPSPFAGPESLAAATAAPAVAAAPSLPPGRTRNGVAQQLKQQCLEAMPLPPPAQHHAVLDASPATWHWSVPALLDDGMQLLAQEQQHAAAGEEGAAPLSAVLEACVCQGLLSQYRAVSRACVRCAAACRCFGASPGLQALRRAAAAARPWLPACLMAACWRTVLLTRQPRHANLCLSLRADCSWTNCEHWTTWRRCDAISSVAQATGQTRWQGRCRPTPTACSR